MADDTYNQYLPDPFAPAQPVSGVPSSPSTPTHVGNGREPDRSQAMYQVEGKWYQNGAEVDPYAGLYEVEGKWFSRSTGAQTDPMGNIATNAPASAMPTDAQVALSEILNAWGLGSLTSWAWGMLTNGASNEQIIYELRKREEYRQRFKGNSQREASGLTPLSEAEYLAYEDQARQLFKANGLPANLFDSPDDFVKYIGGDTSVVELRDRIDDARKLTYDEPLETRMEYRRLFGTTEGQEIAMILDPTRALPLVQREIEAAAMAGAGRRAGLELTLGQAERVGDLTSSVQEAAQGFAAQSKARELFQSLPGMRDDAFTGDEQIDAIFSQGSEQARRLDRRQRQRTAAFQGSGGYLSGNTGASGTGVAR